MPRTSGLFWRSVLAFLALPTVVAFVVPWLLVSHPARVHTIALPIVALGIVLLLWCVRDFYVAGQGTLAPWAPPKHLVTVGLYRVSRNPMYLAVLTILIGWAAALGSVGLGIYAAIVAIAFHLRVVSYEEPWLARSFPSEWAAYRARVPRWLGRRRGRLTTR
jgi:protein-S-isoprenylcysteine O-methyltransferase Ste14